MYTITSTRVVAVKDKVWLGEAWLRGSGGQKDVAAGRLWWLKGFCEGMYWGERWGAEVDVIGYQKDVTAGRLWWLKGFCEGMYWGKRWGAEVDVIGCGGWKDLVANGSTFLTWAQSYSHLSSVPKEQFSSLRSSSPWQQLTRCSSDTESSSSTWHMCSTLYTGNGNKFPPRGTCAAPCTPEKKISFRRVAQVQHPVLYTGNRNNFPLSAAWHLCTVPCFPSTCLLAYIRL